MKPLFFSLSSPREPPAKHTKPELVRVWEKVDDRLVSRFVAKKA